MAAANQLSNFIAAAKAATPAALCQILINIAAAKAAFPSRGGCAENLKKLQIYDIIKGWGFRPAQKIQLMSNFAIHTNLCYNISTKDERGK